MLLLAVKFIKYLVMTKAANSVSLKLRAFFLVFETESKLILGSLPFDLAVL